MKKILSVCALLVLSSVAHGANECPEVLRYMKRKLNSQETVNFCKEYKNQAILMVNTASYCGFTPQFKGLEALYEKYKDQGLVVLGFPSNDFSQEDKDENVVADICELTYGVKFPMFEPMSVRGEDADPLFKKLAKDTGVAPKWNFYKYLVNKDGKVVKSYPSRTTPEDKGLLEDISKALNP